MRYLIILVLIFQLFPSSTFSQGSVGIGKLPRTSSEVKRTLKTILLVKDIYPEKSKLLAKDEITGEELLYTVLGSTQITAEKGLFERKKILQLTDINLGNRLEVSYRESLPTQLTSIKVLKE